MNITILGVAFWTFVAISAVAGIVGDYKKRKLMLEPLRLAIEKGQQLDPKVVGQLMRREQSAERTHPEHLRIGGIITLAAALGVGIAGGFIGQVISAALYWALALSALAACVGIGLIVAGGLLAKHRAIDDASEQQRAGDSDR
jgi:hypothetical protein